MAIVETLEIRFRADLGKLGAQLGAVAGALSGIGLKSGLVFGAVTTAAFLAENAVSRLNSSAAEGEKTQKKLSSRLKKTGRALKNVSAAAKEAAEGIGLHRLDEINLVGGEEKKSSSGGSRPKGGSAADYRGAAADLEKLQSLFKKLPGFFERIHASLRKNMGGVDEWLDKATGGLAGNMAKLLGSAGKNAANALVDRLLGALNTSRPQLAEKGRSLLQSLADGLRSGASATTAPEQAGQSLTSKLAAGLITGRSSVQSAASSVTLAAKFGGNSARSEAESAGKNLSKGFESGLLSYIEKIKTAAGKLASAALDKLKSLLKIASPSKVTFAMGGYFAEGFANGILSGANLAAQSASVLAGDAVLPLNTSLSGDASMAGMVRAAVNEALGGTNIVIPLNVDGVKLGEASIRGINQVTRAAGRLMLEI